MPKKSTSTRQAYRSAVTGKYVTKHYAETHPRTTVKETRRVNK